MGLLYCILLLSLQSDIFAQSAGTISGRVEDGQAKAIAGVSIRLLPRPPLTAAAGTHRAVSAADGTYRFSNLVPGPYQVCAAAPQSDYLDTCLWTAIGSREATIQVAGDRVTFPAIRMSKGTRLRVNVADSSGVLDRDEPLPQARLLVQVEVPGVGFAPVPVVEKGGTQRGYEMLVPRGQALRVRVSSNHFVLSNAEGRAVDAAGGHQQSVTVPADGPVAPITFRVSSLVGR